MVRRHPLYIVTLEAEMAPAGRTRLIELLLADRPTAPRPPNDAPIEEILGRVIARAQDAWPTSKIEVAPFLRYLGDQLPEQGAVLDFFNSAHIDDLILCYACSKKDPQALAALERTYFPAVVRHLTHSGASSALAEEAQQLLRVRLYMARADGPPQILRYDGRGPLVSWLRVVAVRILRDLQRAQKKGQVELGARPLPNPDEPGPESRYAKRRQKNVFEAAFGQSLASLSAQDRVILRLYFLEDLASDAVGKVLHVDGSTVRRRVAQLKQTLLKRTRKALAVDLGLHRSEVESVLALARSQLEISICRLLKSDQS
jgi:RNA polymerase sigma-70 factor (ECF subfamily)